MADAAIVAATTEPVITVNIPAQHHCIILGVFYGHLRKDIQVKNLNTGEIVSNQISCYTGWHACGSATALTTPITLEVRLHCMDSDCGTLGLSSQTPVDRTVDMSCSNPTGSSVGWFMYAPNNITTNDRIGITIVVQSGLGPIDIEL
jgi:hypothetical protein